MKICTSCDEIKNLSEFGFRKEAKDGLWGHCRACANFKSKKWRLENPEKWKASEKKNNRKQYIKNKDSHILKSTEWGKNNRLKRREIVAKYRLSNLERHAAKEAKRRASKLLRVPSWITKEELQDIQLFYINCPEGCHVDHIIPLQGKIVSGFHMLSNLQYLLAIANLKKSNKFEGI